MEEKDKAEERRFRLVSGPLDTLPPGFRVTVESGDGWGEVYRDALSTVGMADAVGNTGEARTGGGKVPGAVWRLRMCRAAHSPLYTRTFRVTFSHLPYWVSVHLVRHHEGVVHYVTSQRTDRTGVPRGGKRQDAPVSHGMRVNAAALIGMSGLRLCGKAAPETRAAWRALVAALWDVDPVVALCCVPRCSVYGWCPEFRTCGLYRSAMLKDPDLSGPAVAGGKDHIMLARMLALRLQGGQGGESAEGYLSRFIPGDFVTAGRSVWPPGKQECSDAGQQNEPIRPGEPGGQP